MAHRHPVAIVLIAARLQLLPQEVRLGSAVEIKLSGAVIFPPVVLVVFSHIQNDGIDIGAQRHPVVIFLVFAAHVFIQNLGILALHLVIAPGIDHGNPASGNPVGQVICQLGILLRLHHGDQVTDQDDEVRILCRGGLRRRCHRLMDIAEGKIVQPVRGVHRTEGIALGNGLSLVAAEGAPIDHLLGADGVTPGGIQHGLRDLHLMYPVRRPHGAGIEVIIAFSPDFHPGDSGIRGGEDNLVIILHRVNHRSIGKVTGPQLIAQKHRRQDGQGYRPRFQGKNCLGTLCHREEQHQRKEGNQSGNRQRFPEMGQNETEVISGTEDDDHHRRHSHDRAGHQTHHRGPFFLRPQKQTDQRKYSAHPGQHRDDQGKIHHQKAGIGIRSQEFGNAAVIDPQRHPKQGAEERQQEAAKRLPIFFQCFFHSFPFLPF